MMELAGMDTGSSRRGCTDISSGYTFLVNEWTGQDFQVYHACGTLKIIFPHTIFPTLGLGRAIEGTTSYLGSGGQMGFKKIDLGPFSRTLCKLEDRKLHKILNATA